MDADVLVVGSGPAGCAAAIVAVAAGLRTLLIEPRRFPRDRPGESFHPGIEPILDRLGVGETVRDARYRRYPGVWVGWNGPLAFQPFGGEPAGPWMGFHAPGADFDRRLQEAAVDRGVELVRVGAEHPLVEEDRVAGVVTSLGTLRAPFVVDAAGRGHWLARHLRLPVRRHSPALVAIYGYAAGHSDCLAREPQIRREARGWTWIAQIDDGLYQWTRLRPRGAAPRRDPPPDLAALRPLGRARGADMTWRSVEPAAGPGYFIVGDAAAVLDPASSHGVLRALMSGMMAGFLIGQVREERAGPREAAAHYRRWTRQGFLSDVDRLRDLYRRAEAGLT